MTTVAIKDNIIACDGLATLGGMITDYDAKKIAEVGGCLVSGAGRWASVLKFQNWFADVMNHEIAQQENPYIQVVMPEDMVEDDFLGLVLYPDGVVYMFEGGQYSYEVKQPVSIGSGSPYALAAMKAGCSAEEAIGIACDMDCYSGGNIQVFELEQPQEGLTEEKFDEMSKEDLKELLFGKPLEGLEDDNETETFSTVCFVVEYDDGSHQTFEVNPDGSIYDCDNDEHFESFTEDSWSTGSLKCIADSLDVKYAHNISDEKLAKRLDEKIKEIIDNMNQ